MTTAWTINMAEKLDISCLGQQTLKSTASQPLLANFVPLPPVIPFMKQFNVPITYRSPLITAVKEKRRRQDKLKKDFTPTLLDFGPLQIYLARHFGFCYGVENAIEIAFRTIDENPGKRIYLLSEMIHNPQVNADLQESGVQFLQDTHGRQLIPFETITAEDIVLIPAFGTTLAIEDQLRQKGIAVEKYNTTCPFVEKVWNRGEQIAAKGYSIVIHGKPKHEETRATFSRAAATAPAVIVNDMQEARLLAKFITGEKPAADFYTAFKGRYSAGFDITRDLQRFGVVNQTTQLATDTQAIAEYLKKIMMQHYGLEESNIGERFADTRDTLCYATNDNQSAVSGMLGTDAHLAIVVGGYNSSNTTHLVELCEEKLPTYFISGEEKLLSAAEIMHFNFHTREEIITRQYFPGEQPVKILVTSGASCPDAMVEAVIRKLISFYKHTAAPEQMITALRD
jgi:4-hydroxy-3-methylbut-2-enyl diphosphate reductase